MTRFLISAAAGLLGLGLLAANSFAYPPPGSGHKGGSHIGSKPGHPTGGGHIGLKPGHQPGGGHIGHNPGGHRLPHGVMSRSLGRGYHGAFTHHRMHPRFNCRLFWHPHRHAWFYWHPVYLCYLPVEYIEVYPPVVVTTPAPVPVGSEVPYE
jgi:hypothetical protein